MQRCERKPAVVACVRRNKRRSPIVRDKGRFARDMLRAVCRLGLRTSCVGYYRPEEGDRSGASYEVIVASIYELRHKTLLDHQARRAIPRLTAEVRPSGIQFTRAS